MFRVSLILKLWNNEIVHIIVKNFIHNLNNKKINIKYQMMNMNVDIKLHQIIYFQQKLFHQNLNQKISFIYFLNIVKMKNILLDQYLME